MKHQIPLATGWSIHRSLQAKQTQTLRLSNTPTCGLCELVDEIPLHWLSNCPPLTNTRMGCFRNYITNFQLSTTANMKDIHNFGQRVMARIALTMDWNGFEFIRLRYFWYVRSFRKSFLISDTVATKSDE